jgi:hypothetical protein
MARTPAMPVNEFHDPFSENQQRFIALQKKAQEK